MTTATRPARETKAVLRDFQLKDTNDADRTFTGLAAAFSLDQGGDIILPGAFKRTLSDFRRSKGKVLPLLDSHNRGSVRAVVGKMLAGEETAGGLESTFQVIDGPDGDEVYRRVKGGYVDGLSIGYAAIDVKQPSPEESLGGIWRYLKEIKLLEVSVVAFPMNTDARIDLATVKGLMARGPDLTDTERDELKELQHQLTALLDTAAPGEPPAPPVPGLAPGDPFRVELSRRVLALKLHRLGVSI